MGSIVDDLQLLSLLIGHQDKTLEILTLNANKESHDRIQLVLTDYFTKQDSKLSTTDIESDAEIIKKIFPDCSLNDVKQSLEEIGDEQNRVKIVLKQLCNSKSAKRSLEYCANDIINKKKLKTWSPQTLLDGAENSVVNKRLEWPIETAFFNESNKIETSTRSPIDLNVSAVVNQTPKSIFANSIKPCTSTSTSDSNNLNPYPTNGINQEQLASSLKSILSNLVFDIPAKPIASNSTNMDSKTDIIQKDLFCGDTKPSSSISSSVDPMPNTRTGDDLEDFFMKPSISGCARTNDMLDIRQDKCIFGSNTNILRNNHNPSFGLTQDNTSVGSSVKPSTSSFAEIDLRPNSPSDFLREILCDDFDSDEFNDDLLSVSTGSFPNPIALKAPSVFDARDVIIDNIKKEEVTVRAAESSPEITSSTLIYPPSPIISSDDGNNNKDNKEPKMLKASLRAPVLVFPPKTTASTYDTLFNTNRLMNCTSSSSNSRAEDSRSFLFKATETKVNRPNTFNGITINERQMIIPSALCGETNCVYVRPKKTTVSVASHHQAKKSMKSNMVITPTTSRRAGNQEIYYEIPTKIRKVVNNPNNEDEGEIITSLDLTGSSPIQESQTTLDTTKLVSRIMEMFPDICPTYLRHICTGKSFTDIDSLISTILTEEDYPKRVASEIPEEKLNFSEQLELMKQVLPEADPDYLEMKCVQLIDKPEDLKIFISNAIETNNYPSKKEYLRKQKLLTQQKQYTTEFNVAKFLEVIPDPHAHFKGLDRKSLVKSAEDEHYAICYLRNRYRNIPLNTIRESYRKCKTILLTCENLDKPQKLLKNKRLACPMPATATQNIPLLQQIAYKEHCSEITQYIAEQKLKKLEERRQFKENGLMETCMCCFDDEVIPTEIYCCELGCKFCKNCVKQSTEVTFGDGKLDFKCLSTCDASFTLQTLQNVVSPKLFSQIASNKQLEEVKSAGIENLEMCPFCNFAAIPDKDDKLFRCFNPDCMKETCRLCKEPSHIPLRCEEVEKEADVKVRTFIENKMTEALLRKCWKCGMKFIKSEGCNKMTCSCGAKMCYVCGARVVDYKHFNGPGGSRSDLCPLYSDLHELHEQAVINGAEQAKQEIASQNQKGELKVDPTTDVKDHYNHLRKVNPVMAIPGVHFPLRPPPPEVRDLLDQGHDPFDIHLARVRQAVGNPNNARLQRERARFARQVERMREALNRRN